MLFVQSEVGSTGSSNLSTLTEVPLRSGESSVSLTNPPSALPGEGKQNVEERGLRALAKGKTFTAKAFQIQPALSLTSTKKSSLKSETTKYSSVVSTFSNPVLADETAG